jgi:3-oxo-5alpha-steroid 4-dehydrogenase
MEPISALEVNEVRFDETVDVVVVGLGVAGTSATSRQAGVDVLAVERSAGPGGTSANSGGLIYLGGGTALQSACGFRDSPENMAAFLRAALGPGVDDSRLDVYCDGSADHFDWLVSIGVPFRSAFCDEPNRESADDSGLLFSGGEDTFPFDEISEPVPRGHKPQCIDSAGGFLMERLGAAVSRSGARLVADARADALVVDGGDVIGVQLRTDDGSRTIRARGGVILATGGFIHNDTMVAEHCPLAHVPDAAWRIGTPADDGRGIRMGAGAGAVATRLDSFECALPLGRRIDSPEESSSTALARGSSMRMPTRVASGFTLCASTTASSP